MEAAIMTTLHVGKIGLVAHYSKQGDWAFTLAFELARRNNVQLNIFCFPDTSYDKPFDNVEYMLPKNGDPKKYLVEEERKLREYYDRYLDDYVNVGFKLCTRNKHHFDMRSCLKKKDFQVLVIPYTARSMMMDNMTIEQFMYTFTAPVILVGPDRETDYRLNSPAKLLAQTSMILPAKFRDSKMFELIEQGHGYYTL
ncbi:hypothetical protein ACFL4Q_01090 [candidate division KSB1 bacterium]